MLSADMMPNISLSKYVLYNNCIWMFCHVIRYTSHIYLVIYKHDLRQLENRIWQTQLYTSISDPMMPIFHIIEVMLLCYISFVYYVVFIIKEYQDCIWRAASVNWGFDGQTCSYIAITLSVRPSVCPFVRPFTLS
jgi:hypothetical protein